MPQIVRQNTTCIQCNLKSWNFTTFIQDRHYILQFEHELIIISENVPIDQYAVLFTPLLVPCPRLRVLYILLS